MFVIRKKEDIVIDWPVSVEIPVAGGKVKKFEFTGLFARLPEEDLQALIDSAREQNRENDRPHADAIVVFGELLKGWTSVKDADGNTIDYSAEVLESMLTGVDGGPVAIGLWRALGQLRTGAKAKN